MSALAAGTPPSRPRRDFPAWIYITSFLVIAVVSILPIIITIVAVGIAQANGCGISESFVSPCLIGGTDYGAALQSAGNSFWLLLFSMPIGFLLFVVWLVAFITHLVVAGGRRKAAVAP
jgi:hypothetical protein